MKKQDKRHKAPAEPPSEGMSIDAILAAQYQNLHQKYEVEEKPVRLGNTFICPACNRQIRQLYAAHCWSCGKRLGWGR